MLKKAFATEQKTGILRHNLSIIDLSKEQHAYFLLLLHYITSYSSKETSSKNMKPYKILIIAAILLCNALSAKAEAFNHIDSLSHSISFQSGFATNDTNHYYYRHDNPDNKRLSKNISFHLRYGFSFAPKSRLGELYPTAYQGIGVSAYSFFAPNAMGRPLCVYLFQGSKILDPAPRLSLGYEWNLGLSWGWVPNAASASSYNVMINVSLPLTWRVAPKWDVAVVPNYTHFSNGDTKFPNSGVDAVGVLARLTYNFDAQMIAAPAMHFLSRHPHLKNRTFGEHITWDLILYGGWRADRFMSNGTFCLINDPIPNWGIQLNPLYHLNQYFSLGLSLDAFTDMSANLYDAKIDPQTNECIGYSRPSLWQQTAIALSARGEISLPIFSVGVGVGVNLMQHGYDMERFYSVFGLKAHLSKRTFLYIGYRLSTLKYTRNIMYGFGFRFGKGAK